MPRFIFTFGTGHVSRVHGSLGNCYTEILADDEAEARQMMVDACGIAWSNSYKAPYDGVQQYNLTLVPFVELMACPPCLSRCELEPPFPGATPYGHHESCKNRRVGS